MLCVVFVVSNVGCILAVDASLSAALESAGMEIFSSYTAASARYIGSDEGKKPLVYFDNQ